jgi:NitT/TauT family transport system permease protein
MNDSQKSASRLLPAVAFIGFLLVWELVSRAGLISASFFPAPTTIWGSFIKLLGNGDLASATGATLLRFLLGFVAGSALGAVLGLLMGWWPSLYAFMDPFIAAIYPIPKIAIFPLLMIIFGIGEGSKFVAVLLAAFFPMLINSLAGVRQISKVYFEVGKNYGVYGRNVFTHILLPGSLPSLMSGLLQSANMAFVIAISVEIVSARNGLGVLLWFGWQTFRVSELYAVLAVIALLGIGLNYAFNRLTHLLVPWMGE